MQVNFPSNVRIQRIRPRLEGLRHAPFRNIDGEPFGSPSLNGYWRVEMDLFCGSEADHLALSGFLTAMRGNATAVIPLTTQWLPNGADGRKLNGFSEAPRYRVGGAGFIGEPFNGYTLRAPASRRDSYIDVTKPELSHLRPGHRITLGDRLHEVIKVSAIDEREDAARLSLMPNVRGSYAAGEVVIVDQIRLRVRMEDAGDLEEHGMPFGQVTATFIEAF